MYKMEDVDFYLWVNEVIFNSNADEYIKITDVEAFYKISSLLLGDAVLCRLDNDHLMGN